jgi:hypothetical protein
MLNQACIAGLTPLGYDALTFCVLLVHFCFNDEIRKAGCFRKKRSLFWLKILEVQGLRGSPGGSLLMAGS